MCKVCTLDKTVQLKHKVLFKIHSKRFEIKEGPG